MQKYFKSGKFKMDAAKVGFYSLSATLFVISFPGIVSRYTLALFLLSGFCLWLTDARNYWRYFCSRWYLIIPPVSYFVLLLVSLMLQMGKIKLLETYLMFLLVPLLGFPVLTGSFADDRIIALFRSFIAGLTAVSIFLIIRILVVIASALPAGKPVFDFLLHNNPDFVSQNFSVLEHPSYLSMKLDFALLLLLRIPGSLKLKKALILSLYIIFSLVIFLLASKSGIFVWIAITVSAIVWSLGRRNLKVVAYVLIIPLLIGLTYLSVRKIDRINYFMVYSGRAIKQKDFDWKNLDQRAREWFTAISLIRERPLTGYGIAKTEASTDSEYLKLGFTDEANLKMNAHNQFLEAQVTFGIMGTFILFWMLLTPVIFKKVQRFVVLAVPFILLISFFLLFESMFNRQWGIMFFLVFYLIIVLPPIHSSVAPAE